MRKLYPIGIQSFEKIRTEGFAYVDKTAYVYNLVTTGCYYFLSRPRRFGKSLLLSTIEAYFQGKSELFEGLSISQQEKDWEEYPVFHLDLNIGHYETTDDLDAVLHAALVKWEKSWGAESSETTLALRFGGIIERAAKATGKKVVILIDEYDKPLLQAIGNEKLQDKQRATLKAFYSVLKTMDPYIQFAFLTGVTKFGKVSVFSDLNNLRDISMSPQYAAICGITEDELYANFREDISQLADATGEDYAHTCSRLKENYDGYRFTKDTVGIYNPFSILNTFANQEFNDYWFETGTPTYLVKLLQLSNYKLEDIEQISMKANTLNSMDCSLQNPVSVIYQSGYLTLDQYNPTFNSYTLKFPNREVKEGFMSFLLPFYANIPSEKTTFAIQMFAEDIQNGQVDDFMCRLQSFFADTPYLIVSHREVHYQNVLYILFRLLGFYVEVEYVTNRGRIDLVMKTDRYIYVMEFKLDGSAADALRQINDKGYAEPFIKDGRKLVKIGVNFNDTVRNIEKWLVE